MDKVLIRKLFKDKYLQTVSKKVSHFKNGGLAGLKNQLEQYAPKGEFLAYINKKEANVLKALGGSGKIVKETGIPSFESDSDFADALANASGTVDPKTAAKLLANPDIYPTYSEGERTAMLLAPIASQLLTGTQQPGQSQLGAVASNVGAAIPKVMETSMQMRKLESDRLGAIAKLSKSTATAATPFQKALAASDVKSYENWQEKRDNARTELNDLEAMKALYENENLKVGAMSGAKEQIARFAKAAGIETDIQDVKGADLLKMLSGKTSLLQLKDLKGAISDKEGEWIRSMNPTLASSREGGLAIIEFKKELAKKNIAYADKMDEWVNKYGDLRAKDSEGRTWQQESKQWIDKNNVLSKQMLDIIKSPEQRRSDQASVSGTPTRPIFRNPADGKTYIKNSEGKWELAR
jgi:hypothetical protein